MGGKLTRLSADNSLEINFNYEDMSNNLFIEWQSVLNDKQMIINNQASYYNSEVDAHDNFIERKSVEKDQSPIFDYKKYYQDLDTINHKIKIYTSMVDFMLNQYVSQINALIVNNKLENEEYKNLKTEIEELKISINDFYAENEFKNYNIQETLKNIQLHNIDYFTGKKSMNSKDDETNNLSFEEIIDQINRQANDKPQSALSKNLDIESKIINIINDNDLSCLDQLLCSDNNLLTKLFYGSTLLQLSIMHDKTDLIKKLLEIDNSQLHIPNMQGESAFKIALRSGNEENIMLIANGIDNTQEELLNLVQNREFNLLEDALDMININAEIRANLLTKAVEINAREYVLNLINSSKYLDNNSSEEITSLIKKDIEAVDSYSNLSLKCSDSYEIKDSFGTMVIGETIESM